MRDALQQKLDRLEARINEARDVIEDENAETLEELEGEFRHARERIEALWDSVDGPIEDQSDLALREAGRALDELGNRLDRTVPRQP